MKLDWKVIVGGGVLMYVTQFIVSLVTGGLIHEGVLDPLYQATTEFWRPELNQDPPDMAALMPHWIASGLLAALVQAGIYDNIRSALNGSGLLKGLKFGLILAMLYALTGLAYSGVFNLPPAIWGWWALDGLIVYSIGGLVLGWFAGKFGTD
ncbi:MAG: hypothetical protein KJO80_04905 [Gammaproteobacteria bacterium]|nr:hypothetical protein [Gammaproteobacteria bacterium]NNK99254.1 hypothetical protein [Xanthomonadales bacterium]